MGFFYDMDAKLSADGTYRHVLTRTWRRAPGMKKVCFIMLNPSTADGLSDDATIRKCVALSKRWKYDALAVVNLFDIRTSSPTIMKRSTAPCSKDNNHYIRDTANRIDRSGGIVVAAWGTHGTHQGRNAEVMHELELDGTNLYALKLSKDGHPYHPLYLPMDTKPVLWRS